MSILVVCPGLLSWKVVEPHSVRSQKLHAPILCHPLLWWIQSIIPQLHENNEPDSVHVNWWQCKFPYTPFDSFQTESLFHLNVQILAWPTSGNYTTSFLGDGRTFLWREPAIVIKLSKRVRPTNKGSLDDKRKPWSLGSWKHRANMVFWVEMAVWEMSAHCQTWFEG